jgi:hypothetical protein
MLRLRPQPSAAVRNRSPSSVRGRYGHAYGDCCKSGGGLKCRVISFRVAGVALRGIPTRFITCPKSFCATGAIL